MAEDIHNLGEPSRDGREMCNCANGYCFFEDGVPEGGERILPPEDPMNMAFNSGEAAAGCRNSLMEPVA
jgi:hypothetical protein